MSDIDKKLEEAIEKHIDDDGNANYVAMVDDIKQVFEDAGYCDPADTASKIFNLAHEYARADETMIGSEELRNYHYFNAIHTVGKFGGR